MTPSNRLEIICTNPILNTNELKQTTTPTIVENDTTSLSNSHNKPFNSYNFYEIIEKTNTVEIAGEKHFIDRSGCSHTLKTSDASTDRNYWEYLLSHYYAVTAYKALGVPVPEVRLYDMDTNKPVNKVEQLSNRKNIGLLFKDIHGLQSIKDYLNTDIDGSRYYYVQRTVQKYFVADCLFGNKGSNGDEFENMLIEPHSKVIYRMNCSGTFGYNNKGGIVGQFNTSEIKELKTLRDKTQKPEAIFFKTIKNKKFKEQAEKIYKERFKFTFPDDFLMLKQYMDLRSDLLHKIPVLPDVEGLDTIDYQAWESKTDLVEKRRFLCDVFTQEQISDEDVLKFLKSNITNPTSLKEIFYNTEKLNWLGELLKKERPNVFEDGSIFA